MSIPNLPVDFKDDILASSNTKRKYRQTTNGDSTVSFEDVTNYSQEGSEFGAKEVNQTNTAINNIYDERVLDVDALELITEPGFFVDAQVVKELNGKMTEIGVEQSYSENGWSVSYRSIGANRVYFITSKTVSSIVAGGNQLEIAALPFKVAFEQHIYLAMNVSGTPVGYGYTRIVPTSGSGNTSAMYRNCAGYSNAVTMLTFGELVIQ